MDEGPNLRRGKGILTVRVGHNGPKSVWDEPWVREQAAPREESLLERVVDSTNMQRAWKQVRANAGIAGVDGRNIEVTQKWLREHWPELRQQILEGRYRPYPVKRIEIPKPEGGKRKLGIPTVIDRLIQQAISQVLTPIFDPEFSESSFGFRPGKSAHDAVRQAHSHQQAGKQWVVDMDLKAFFDEVDHDLLMARIGKRIKDKGLKRLINGYLKAGIAKQGEIEPSEKGTPQGGPLSPVLSNILLDDLDKELEKRGLSFSRYADDCNIYVNSRKAGKRVMESISRMVEEKLKLKVNREKSAVARPWARTFLGYTFRKIWGKMRICVPKQQWQRLRKKVREVFGSGRGQNLKRFVHKGLNPILRGWYGYFKLGVTQKELQSHDFWVRRRIRCLIWRQWKRPATRFKNLRKLGCPLQDALVAYTRRGPWWSAGTSQMTRAIHPRKLTELGLFSLVEAC